MAELPPLPPGFSLDQPANGPVYGPPPAAPKPRDPLQVEIDQERLNNLRNPKPNLPAGYEMGPDGIARRIPGLPAEATKGGEDDVKIQQKRAALTSLETQINRVDELYRKGFKDESLGILSSLSEYLPSDEAAQLNAAGAGLAEQGLAAFRVPGVGSQSDTELRQFVEANRPSTWDRDTAVEEKLRQLRARVDATRAEMGLPPAQWLGSEQDQGAPMPSSGGEAQYLDQSRNLAEVEGPSGDQLVRSQGTQTVDNPALKGVRGEYLRRLEAGQAPGEIIQFLRSAGVTDPKVLRSAVEQVNFRRQYPNVPIANYNTSAVDDMDVPLSATESMMNEAAQSPLGAYGMAAGQAASMNLLDEAAGALGGNEERARIALQDTQNTNPIASTVGSVSGSVMGALGGEAALASRGIGAGLGRSVAADTAFGAASGAGAADEGNRIGGAVTGGLAGLGGSLGGNLVAKGVGSAISPTGGRLADLYEAGVRPTPGQRMMAAGDGRGLAGMVGRVVGTTEEAIGSVPIIGAGIRGARQEARDQFQIGAYNEMLGELKGVPNVPSTLPKNMRPGTEPYRFAKKAVGDVYDMARSGMQVAPDAQLAADVATLRSSVDNLADPSIARFEKVVENVIMRRTGATIDGEAFKKIQSDIGGIIRGIRKSPSGDSELADALTDLQSILDSAARRHSPPEAVAMMDKADAAYAKFVRIRDAAKSRGGAAAEFSPTQFDRSVQRNTAGRYSDAYLRGDALMQQYADQGMALVDRIPNSGTPERLMTGGVAAGGLTAVEPNTLGVLGIIGSLYAPGVRKATAGIMTPRGGPKTKAVANAVRKRARIAGATGAGVALSAQTDDGR